MNVKRIIHNREFPIIFINVVRLHRLYGSSETPRLKGLKLYNTVDRVEDLELWSYQQLI